MRAVEVHFTPELQARLDRAAAEIQQPASEYVQQLVDNYLEFDAEFRQKVTASLARLDRGEFLTHDEVRARIEKMFQP